MSNEDKKVKKSSKTWIKFWGKKYPVPVDQIQLAKFLKRGNKILN